MNFLISDAWAQAGGGGGAGLIGLLPMVAIFVIFYFLLIRPQQKKAKEHRAMVADLSKGDEIVTNGGVLGKITDTDENFVTVEVASGVSIQVQRLAVAQMMPKGTIKSAK
jgi:preprotein translocase subunit YajC